MADMFDSGVYAFTSWARGHNTLSQNRVLGRFDPDIGSDMANDLLDHVGKLTEDAQAAFKRGWDHAAKTWKEKTNHWYITKAPIDPKDVGRRSMDANMDWFETSPLPIPFRLYDGDGELYYEGLMAHYDFEPLDDFGMPNAGCTELRYKEDGQWKTL